MRVMSEPHCEPAHGRNLPGLTRSLNDAAKSGSGPTSEVMNVRYRASLIYQDDAHGCCHGIERAVEVIDGQRALRLRYAISAVSLKGPDFRGNFERYISKDCG